MSDMAWIQVGIVVGLIFQFVTMLIKRKWDREDKIELAVFTAAEAKKTRAKVEAQHHEVLTEIATNTAVSVEAKAEAQAAYTEANDVNRKIAELQQRLIALTNRPSRATDPKPTVAAVRQAEQIDNVERTVGDIKHNTDDIKQAVVDGQK